MPSYVWIILLVFVAYRMTDLFVKKVEPLSAATLSSSGAGASTIQIITPMSRRDDNVLEHIPYPRLETDPLIPPGRPGSEYYNGRMGGPNQFEKWGFLTGPDGQTRVPLYGRRVNGSGDDYEYYVVMPGNNKVMLSNRKEIYSDDVVSAIPTVPDGGDWSAYIYKPFNFMLPYW